MAISAHPLRRAVSAGIKYGLDYLGFKACVAAHLDLLAWDSGMYPRRFMARVIAWYKLSGLEIAHTEDARNTAAEKEAKKK